MVDVTGPRAHFEIENAGRPIRKENALSSFRVHNAS